MAAVQINIKIQLMLLAPNQLDNSNFRKKLCGKNKTFSNNHCIASKNALIIGGVEF